MNNNKFTTVFGVGDLSTCDIEEIVMEENCITNKIPGYPSLKSRLHKNRLGSVSVDL